MVLAVRLGEITVYADLKIRHQRRLVLSLPVAYLYLCRCLFWGAGVREVPEAPKINWYCQISNNGFRFLTGCLLALLRVNRLKNKGANFLRLVPLT